MKILKLILALGLIQLVLAVSTAADPKSRTSITRTSPNHTEIVIHDYSPQAKRERRRHLEQARRHRELKERRAHELKLARIRASSNSDIRVSTTSPTRTNRRRVGGNFPALASIRERQKRNAYEPAPFFNGGRSTGFTYGGGLGNFGFNGGFSSGYGFNFSRGYRRSYRPSTRCRPVRRSRGVSRARRVRCR